MSELPHRPKCARCLYERGVHESGPYLIGDQTVANFTADLNRRGHYPVFIDPRDPVRTPAHADYLDYLDLIVTLVSQIRPADGTPGGPGVMILPNSKDGRMRFRMCHIGDGPGGDD